MEFQIFRKASPTDQLFFETDDQNAALSRLNGVRLNDKSAQYYLNHVTPKQKCLVKLIHPLAGTFTDFRDLTPSEIDNLKQLNHDGTTIEIHPV